MSSFFAKKLDIIVILMLKMLLRQVFQSYCYLSGVQALLRLFLVSLEKTSRLPLLKWFTDLA